jgi:hypothetical protein
MSRNGLNIIVDSISALNLLGLAMTGLVLRFVLPPGSGPRSLWTLRRHDWGGVHFWLAVSLCTVLVLHVALHWQWVCSVVRRLVPGHQAEDSRGSRLARNLAGIAFLTVLVVGLTGFVWVARLDVQQVPRGPGAAVRERPEAATTRPGRGDRGRDRRIVPIRGSTTLSQAATSNDVPVAALRERLGLPQDVDSDERLDRLGRRYGFNISQARRVVAELKQEPQ